MLTRVEIENFKAIEKLSMDFTSRLTVIVGPNGSGKTSILQAIKLFGAEVIPTKFVRTGLNLHSLVRLRTSYEQSFRVSSDPHDAEAARPSRQISFTDDEGVKSVQTTPRPPFGAVLLRFSTSEMGLPSLDEGNPPPLNSDGSNLASVLSALCLNQPQQFETIKSRTRDVIPQIRQIRFQRVKLPKRVRFGEKHEEESGNGSLIGDQLLFDMLQADSVPADSVSEGTLLVLGIITAAVLGTGQLSILIDDVDASLHPVAQAELVRAIRTLISERPDLQIIATSHSPYLLDSLTHEEIRLTTLDDQGRVVCGTLMDHPDFERWKDEMTPGEMWSMFGEKWLPARLSAVAPAEIMP